MSKFNFGKKVVKNIFKNYDIVPTLFDKKKFVNRPRNMSLSNIKLSKIYKVPSINIQINNLFKEYNNKYYINFKKNKNNEKN